MIPGHRMEPNTNNAFAFTRISRRSCQPCRVLVPEVPDTVHTGSPQLLALGTRALASSLDHQAGRLHEPVLVSCARVAICLGSELSPCLDKYLR